MNASPSSGQASALARYLPALRGRLGSVALGAWPTPVRPLPHLSHHIGAELWLKQDGYCAPGYGGNKVRKLELLLAEAEQTNATRLLTLGGSGSNHVVATAIHGRSRGFETAAAVAPQLLTETVAHNIELMKTYGVELWPCASRASLPLAWAQLRHRYPGAYAIAPGGSSPLGTLGCVLGGLELAEQIRGGQLPCPDLVVVPLGSAGTAAGLMIGLGHARLPLRILAVRVVESPLCNRLVMMALALRTVALLSRHGLSVGPMAPVDIDGSQLGAGYGSPTPSGTRALALAARTEGLALDPTYTAKALAALLDRRWPPSSRILFWNTHDAQTLGIQP